MFCPNCGTQNPEAALACSKCNFHLKSVAAPKFKGTMLMMNQTGAAAPAAPAGASPGQRPGAPAQPGPGAAPPPGQAPHGGSNRLKGTMVGVAPMAGPIRGMAAPVAVASPLPPPPGGPMTPLPPPPSEMSSSFSPPVPQPGVNPLGGTMAADHQVTGGFGGPPPGAPFVATGPQGTAMIPAGSGGSPYAPYGAAPQPGAPQPGAAMPSPYDAPAIPGNVYSTPPPPNPFAGPPPGYSGQGGFGPSMGASPGSMMAYGQGAPMMGGPASAAAFRGGPTRRDPLRTFLLPLGAVVAGVILSAVLGNILGALALLGSLVSLGGVAWAVVLGWTMASEVKGVTQNPSFVLWHLFLPFYNIYWAVIVVPQEVARAKQLLGVSAPVRPTVFYFFLWPFALASDINEMVR